MGHVNNAVYFTYFEQARLVMAETLGLKRELDAAGLGLILAQAACNYKVQVKFGDTIDVRMTVASLGRTSFVCDYELRRVKDDAVVATGTSVQVVFDYATDRPTPIPDTLREKLTSLGGAPRLDGGPVSV